MDEEYVTEGPPEAYEDDLSKTVCVLCRQRKVKCDRKRPTCGHCSKNGFKCRWITSQQKPGLRAGYISGLEKRLSVLEREVRELKTQQQSPISSSTNASTSSSPNQRSFQNDTPVCPNTPVNRTPEFYPLAYPVLDELCGYWFESYHSWFPILHQSSILDALQVPVPPHSSSLSIVFKAITAVTVRHVCRAASLSSEQQQHWSDKLRSEVILQGMSHLSLSSLQAVLILSILDYGAGRLSEFWNLIALCKRMSTQLGLRDMVTNDCANFNQLSVIPPRMLPLPNTLLSQEENIRAYWMTEVLDASSTIGAAWNLTLSKPMESALLPRNDASWLIPEPIVGRWPFDRSEFSSSFSLYVDLVANELWHVHNFLQQTYDIRLATDRTRAQCACQEVDEKLIKWRLGPGAVAFRLTNRGPSVQRTLFDPNILLARCTFHAHTTGTPYVTTTQRN